MSGKALRSFWQYNNMSDFLADGGPENYGKGYLEIENNLYRCNGITLQKILREKAINFGYENITPTLFFDPAAVGSTGVGTFTNPFTTNAQLKYFFQTLSGNLSGKVIGFKRGSVWRGPMNFEQTNGSGIYGTAGDPGIFIPYGDAELKPRFTSSVISTGWVRTAGYSNIWQKTMTEQEIYHIGDIYGFYGIGATRYVSAVADPDGTALATCLNSLSASGGGYKIFKSGIMYISPVDGSDPNLGQTEETTSDWVNEPIQMHLNLANVANTGNIQIHGLHCDAGSLNGFQTFADASGSIATITGIVINDCIVSRIGTDSQHINNSEAGISLTGISDTVRLDGTIITNNRIDNVINNAVELTCTKNSFVAYNYATCIGGNNIIELYGSNSNDIAVYNKGSSFSGSGHKKPVINQGFSSAAFWQSGFTGIDGPTDGTKNVDNIIAFNESIGNKLAFRVYAGTCTIANNNIDVSDGSVNEPACQHGTVTSSADLTVINNAIFETWSNTETAQNPVFYRSYHASDILRGGNNIFAFDFKASGNTLVGYFRGTGYSWNGNKRQDVVDAWAAAVAAVTPGAMTGCKVFSSSLIGVDKSLPSHLTERNGAKLLPGVLGVSAATVASNALVVGKEYLVATLGTGTWTNVGAIPIVGYKFKATATTNGAADGTCIPLPAAISDGALGYRTDLNGELLSGNHIGCYQAVKTEGAL